MARGRKPKPAEIARRDGNPGKRPIGDPVLVGERVYARDALPELPQHLALADEMNETTEARDLWHEIAALLIDANLLTGGDLLVLPMLVESILIARSAYADLIDGGSVVQTMNPHSGRSAHKANPSFKVWADANKMVLKIAEQYGLTPVARARLGLAIGKGRKIAQELGDGLPENPRRVEAPDDDAPDVIDVIPNESE